MPKKGKKLEPVFLSTEKIAEISAELHELEHVTMPEIRQRMATAYEDGDMPENNPWLTASSDMEKAMKQRSDLRELLARTKLFKKEEELETLQLGNSAKISINGGSCISVHLVSSEEAAPAQGKVSIESPIGRGLIGRKQGDTITVETPGKTLVVAIL